MCSIVQWSSTKFVQIMPLGPKLAPPLGTLVLHRTSLGKILENLLLLNCKTQSLDILCFALSRGPLPSLFKSCPWGQNWHRPGVTCFTQTYIGKIFKNLLLLNRKARSLDILCVALSRGSLPSLFKLCPWGQNWPRPGVSLVLHKTCIRKILENLLLLNRRAWSLDTVFYVQHLGLYQVFKDWAPWLKIGPALGFPVLFSL